jgi:hypothetical protein
MILLESLRKRVAGPCYEGVEHCGDSADLGLNVGRSLTRNLKKLVSSRGGRESVAIDRDIDGGLIVIS